MKPELDVLHNHRFRQLDGIRGIASLCVGVTHAFGAVIIPPAFATAAALTYTVRCLVNGGIAVDLFFIMSGFFLAGMVEGARGKNLALYYIRRFVRLAPPAIVAVILCYIYALAIGHTPITPHASTLITDFFNFAEHPPMRDVLMNLTLIRHEVNPALWTIRIELMVSAIFPLLLLVKNLKAQAWYRIAVFVALSLLGFLLRHHQKSGLEIFHYLYLFSAGTLVRDYGPRLTRLGTPARAAGLTFAFLILLADGFLDPGGSNHAFAFDFICAIAGGFTVAFIGFAAPAAAAQAGVTNFLTSQVVQFLGRISYSFYLLNEPGLRVIAVIILSAAPALHLSPPASVLIIFAISIPCTLAAAYLFNIAVEQPCVALSRRFAP